MDYMLAIVEQTRHHESLALGVSPRGSQALYRAVQALALLEGRDYAIPDDVKRLAVPVFAHRVVINTRNTLVAAARRRGRAHHRGNPQPGGSPPVEISSIMKTAIIGLPMTGKTSLFTILTGVHQETRIGSTAVRTGVAKVPDARLEALGRLFEPPKVTHATVEYVDMPSISKESLRDPAYMASLRVVDAFAHVLRLFEDETIPHEKGSVDPLRDLEDVETELILSDLVVVEKRLERLDKDRKKIKNPELDREFELLERCASRARRRTSRCGSSELDAEDEKRIRGFQFLSQKPMLYVLNLGEEEAAATARARAGIPRGPAGRTAQHGRDRGLRQDRGRAGANCRAKSRPITWPATD